MTSDVLLIELAPIEIPLEPSIWPLPISVWFLLLLVVAAALFFWRKRARRPRAQVEAMCELFIAEKTKNISELNQLLRKISLTIARREEVAGLHGKAWLIWLDNQLDQSWFTSIETEWHHALFASIPLSDDHWKGSIERTRAWIEQLDWSCQC
jgi:hypothetical protein